MIDGTWKNPTREQWDAKVLEAKKEIIRLDEKAQEIYEDNKTGKASRYNRNQELMDLSFQALCELKKLTDFIDRRI